MILFHLGYMVLKKANCIENNYKKHILKVCECVVVIIIIIIIISVLLSMWKIFT